MERTGSDTYAYDEDGYLASKITDEGTTHYRYGMLGELRSVVKPDGTVIEYIHNAHNQRVAKEINGTVTEKYLWLNRTTLLATYDGSGNLVSRFEYASSRMPYRMVQSGQTYYLHYDQVGTLKAITDQSGTILKAITYDAFGNVLTDTNPGLTVPFGFAGGLYDEDTELTRFGYRDYDAFAGKWTAKDPIGFDGGDANLYGYVLSDPVNLVDPEGLHKQDKLFGFPKKFWKWFHKLNNGNDIKDLKGPNGQVSKEDAEPYYNWWKDLNEPRCDNKGSWKDDLKSLFEPSIIFLICYGNPCISFCKDWGYECSPSII